MEPHDKTALCKEGGFIVGGVSSFYDSSYLKETLIKSQSQILQEFVYVASS